MSAAISPVDSDDKESLAEFDDLVGLFRLYFEDIKEFESRVLQM